MPRDHLREFLQVTLKQAWSLSEDAVIRQLRASMRELGKLQCLLPPEGESSTRPGPCSLGGVSSGSARPWQPRPGPPLFLVLLVLPGLSSSAF